MASKSAETPTNADGFGVGWYDKFPKPGLFRSTRPAWNDFNLRDLAAHIESPLFLAHVRATSMASVEETNCHPFRHGKWLFVHNGEIFGIESVRKLLVTAISDELFTNIQGTTDSEVMFYLALTLGLERDPVGGLSRMAGFVEEAARSKGIAESLWMTLGLSDGERIFGVRYASDGAAPTLHCTRDAEEIYRDHPDLDRAFGTRARIIASEPGGKFPDVWQEVAQNSFIVAERGKLERAPFKPVRP